MKIATQSLLCLLTISVCAGGCARTARDTQGFTIVKNAVVETGFEQTWNATKAVLRAHELDIYTRDKRGTFVARTPVKRRYFLLPRRTQYTIVLEPVEEQSTRISIEALRQVYGVTLLTYPGWHDRKTTDDTAAAALLEALTVELVGS